MTALLDAVVREGADNRDTNKVEAAHSNVFVSGWRPFIGWVCGAALCFQYLVRPFWVWAAAIWLPDTPVPPTLDGMLWSLAPQDFVAHGGTHSTPEVREASPVLLLPDPRQARVRDVLLNLGAEVPAGFSSYRKVVEVVCADDAEDREQARGRWRHYAARGYAIARHDLVLKP